MDPLREFGKTLILLGLIVAGLGGVLFFGGGLPLRLGRLPGDIAIQGRRGGSFYFPIVTCLLLSILLTLVIWLFGWLRK